MKMHSRFERERINLAWFVLLMALAGAAIFYVGQTFNTPMYAGSDYRGRGAPL
jgi:hypothetical protein